MAQPDEADDVTVDVEVDDDSTGQSFSEPQFKSDGTEPEGSIVNDLVNTAIEFVQRYGWFILIIAVVTYFLLAKRRSQRADDSAARSRQTQGASQKDEKVDERNAAMRERHLEAMLLARARQQSETDKQVEEFREAQKIKQAERDAEQIAEYERLYGKTEGHRLGSGGASASGSNSKPSGSQQNAPKPPSSARTRPDNYMPLGGASSGSYRASGARCRPGNQSS